MRKIDITETVLQFCFNHGVAVEGIVVGYGAAAVMHGLHEQTTGIDIDTSEAIFEWIWCMEGAVGGEGLTGQMIQMGDHLDFHVGDHEDKVCIDGIWVVSKKELLRQYEWLYDHPMRMANKKVKDLVVIKTLKACM